MKREYPIQPIVGVGIVIIRDDKVLLARRGKAPRVGEWSLPGGAQKLGETVFEAAAREAQEETGLQIKVLGVVDVIDSIQRDENQEIKYHYTLIDVFAEVLGGEAVADDDAAEVCWIGCDEIETLELWNETARVIRLGHEMWAALHAC